MKPIHWVHRGRVMAVGARVDRGVRGEHVARQRVVDVWQPGDRLFGTDTAYVVWFAEPRRLQTTGAVEPIATGSLSTFPDERPGSRGSIRRCVGGLEQNETLEKVEPLTWFAGPPVATGRSLAPPMPAAGGREPVALGRASFGVGEAQPGTEALIGELRAGAGGQAGGGGPSIPTRPPTPAEPRPWTSFLRGVSAFFGRVVSNTPVERALQSRHERMLSDVLERFEGDVDEALRHAIPLGKDGVSAASHPALRAPTPWSSLRPKTRTASPGGGSYQASSTLFESLKETYAATAMQLEAEGQAEKAAFIWANLLGDVPRAIEVLETHGAFELASRLALENDQADVAVRLRLAAGDLPGAIAIAHRNQCFAEAVRRLDDDQARGLRAAWAAHLLHLGRVDAAIEVVWHDPTLRLSAAPWLAEASKRDGRAGAIALARWAELDLGRASAAFEQRAFDVEGATTLLQQRLPDAWRRPLARQLLGRAEDPGFDRAAVLQGLAHPLLVDLRVELPLQRASTVASRYTFGLEWGGAWPVHDAAPVAVGWVIAHGESGAVVVDRRGDPLLSIDAPVHHVVVEQGGFQAVLLASLGGERYRLSRLDVRTLTVTPWTRAELSAWSRRIENGRWPVVFDGRLHAMDLASTDWDWLYQGLPLDGRALAVESADQGCSVVLEGVDRVEVYDRRYVRSSTRDFVARELFAIDGQASVDWDGDTLVWRHFRRMRVIALEPTLVAVEAWGFEHLVTARLSPAGVVVEVLETNGAIRTSVALNDVDHVVLRRRGDRVVVHDRMGRVVELLQTGEARVVVSR